MAPLDAEEKAILESVELGEWQPVINVEQEIQRYQHYAQAEGQTTASVSIELPASDLQSLMALSQQAGVPLKALMTSVLHQYAASQLDRRVE